MLPWQVEAIRKSYFLPAQSAKLGPMFQAVTGVPPETRAEQVATGTMTEEGLVGGRRFTVVVGPARLDVVVSPVLVEPEVPSLGGPEESIAILRGIDASLSVQPTRVAVGMSLLFPADSHTQCYEALASILPGTTVKNEWQDFLHRYNEPVVSAVQDNLSINRIRTWQAIKFEFERLDNKERIVRYAVKQDIDLSTAAEGAVLVRPSSEYFNELESIALSFATGEK